MANARNIINTQSMPQWIWATRWEWRLQAMLRLAWAASALLATMWVFSAEAQGTQAASGQSRQLGHQHLAAREHEALQPHGGDGTVSQTQIDDAAGIAHQRREAQVAG
jgi:hypothetical protein